MKARLEREEKYMAEKKNGNGNGNAPKTGQPGREKPLGSESAKAIGKVLGQQKAKHWDSGAHRAGISYLAEAFGLPHAKASAFRAALAEEPWDYASNMKKRLASSQLIPMADVAVDNYE